MSEKNVELTLTISQALAVSKALDVFVSLGLGQLEHITELVMSGVIPSVREDNTKQGVVDSSIAWKMRELQNIAKAYLGLNPSAGFSLGDTAVSKGCHRAYEVKKVLDKAIADECDPTPNFKTVRHDGLLVRYTDDPAPTAVIQPKVANT